MKTTLLLLHGALGSSKQFNAIEKELNLHFDVHALNFEGHGGSSSANDFSMKLFTENVLHYVDAHSISECSIFGYSMGGYVALNAALRIPEKITKITTLGTKYDWSMETAKKEVRMLNPGVIEEKVPAFAEKLEQEHHPEDWKQVMTKTAEMMLGLAKDEKLTDEDFQKLTTPVTIGIGTLDNMVSIEESMHVASLIPNGELVELDGVKHPIDKVEKEVLTDFILAN